LRLRHLVGEQLRLVGEQLVASRLPSPHLDGIEPKRDQLLRRSDVARSMPHWPMIA